jgi:hypothetical protein
VGGLLVALVLLPRPVLSGPEATVDAGTVYKVHYTLAGQDALAHGSVDGDRNGVPDDADAIAAGVKRVHDHWVGKAGMRAPLGDKGVGGDDRVDVYVRKLDGPRGYTHEEDVGALPASSAWIELDPRTALQSVARLSAAAGHEAHHAIQYAYSPSIDTWMKEATATWVEDTGFDGLQPEADLHFLGVLAHPEIPVTLVNGIHEYDEMSLVAFLMDGTPDARMDELWRRMADKGALDGLAAFEGEDTAMTLCRYAAWLDTACSGAGDGGPSRSGCTTSSTLAALLYPAALPPLTASKIVATTDSGPCGGPAPEGMTWGYDLSVDDGAVYGTSLFGATGCTPGSGGFPYRCHQGTCVATAFVGRGRTDDGAINLTTGGIDCIDRDLGAPTGDLRAAPGGADGGALKAAGGCACRVDGEPCLDASWAVVLVATLRRRRSSCAGRRGDRAPPSPA